MTIPTRQESKKNSRPAENSKIRKVDATCILQKVMSIIRSARQEILATMNLSEEVRDPIPFEYFSLLNERMKGGVRVVRLAFGTATDFEIITQRHKVRNKNYKCCLAATKNYKRMLLIDHKHLFFAIENGGERRFFYTTNSQYIKKFSQYFHRELIITEYHQ